ncbi:MAG: glycosyltransferase family 4 protein [Bacteroidaceae bacterium]|nr:glycosyltransferase family 4 protein [Bacteroidaceae bacterium]
MKIVYCLNSIRYLGGIQRVTVVKANALADLENNEVYIVVTDNKNGIITEPLSSKVHLIDLDINYYEDDYKSRWNVLKGIFIKRREHKKRLASVLNEIQPDIVISVGQSEKNMIPSIKGQWKTIREFHYTKNYRFNHAHSFFDKILAYWGNIYDYNLKIKDYNHIVVLTNEDKETNWFGWENISVIPNPSTFQTNNYSNLSTKTVISVGRLVKAKNYASLIRAFKNVVDKHPDWTLEIYGDGPQEMELKSLIDKLNLKKHVFLKGFSSNVKEVMTNASIFALSSIFEGFGLVIVEAMACSLPVVSYACPCGPKDIITDGKDGFLVEVNDEKELANKINLLIENKALCKQMSDAAKIKAEQYNINHIIPKWMNLFQTLRNDQ